MNTWIIVAALLTVGCKTTSKSVPLIVGGEPVPQDHPLHGLLVVISHKGKFRCSGVLVDPKTVATAAHCVRSDNPTDFVVHIGETLASSAPNPVLKLATAIPWSQNSGPRHDVAWLEIRDEQKADFLPLLEKTEDLKRAEAFVVGGYGRTSSVKSDYGRRLMAEIAINHVKDGPQFRNILITGPNPGRGTCEGDSGGPGIARIAGKWYLATVVFGAPDDFFTDTACEAGQDAQTLIAPYTEQLQVALGRQNPSPARPSANYNKWSDWCDNWQTLSIESGLIVSHLLSAVSATDCRSAEPKLAAMTHLNLADRQISDIRPLASLKSLVALDLSYNRIKNGSPLGELGNLQLLNVQQNPGIELTALRKVSSLQRILAHQTGITGLDFLGENVEEVVASCNALKTIDPSELSQALRIVDLRNNRIADISAILALPKIEIVQVKGNPIRPDRAARIAIYGPEDRSCSERWRFNPQFTVFNR